MFYVEVFQGFKTTIICCESKEQALEVAKNYGVDTTCIHED